MIDRASLVVRQYFWVMLWLLVRLAAVVFVDGSDRFIDTFDNAPKEGPLHAQYQSLK